MEHLKSNVSNRYLTDSSTALLQVVDASYSKVPAENSWQILSKARNFAEPFIANEYMLTGEYLPDHVEGVIKILKEMGGSETLQTTAYIAAAWAYLNRPLEVISKNFGQDYAKLADEYFRLIEIGTKASQQYSVAAAQKELTLQEDIEKKRRMLLAFSRDLRVVFLVLAATLQTLRYYIKQHKTPPEVFTQQIQYIYAPLANRLGLRCIKWELEDLSFRFVNPQAYYSIAKKIGKKRIQRENYIKELCADTQQKIEQLQINCDVQGRPKNIYGIYKKMQGKSLPFERIFDLLAMRVLVENVDDCYQVLDWVQHNFKVLEEEFDDYIANPKPNGYQSIHVIVKNHENNAIEIQIRTYEMHNRAESGAAAHWVYKEAGTKGYNGVSATGSYDQKIAILRNLLEWGSGLAQTHMADVDLFDDRIYVFTPQARLIDLPQGSTALDFAYALHTDLGHRCRGAKIDGQMLPLSTALKNGQTVEVITVKEGGPSRDWLNADFKFLVSNKAKAKVRAWFNQQAAEERQKKGREAIEKLLQRKGKTAIKLDELANKLGFKTQIEFFDVVGREEYSLKNIARALAPGVIKETVDLSNVTRGVGQSKDSKKSSSVLVVGVDSLLTQLARCCRPAPPDDICGYVTRGKGVSIHRRDCTNLKGLLKVSGERMVDVSWDQSTDKDMAYVVDISVECIDYIDTLRQVLDLFAKLGNRIVSVQSKDIKQQTMILLSVETKDVSNLSSILAAISSIKGVLRAQRAMN